MKKILFVTSDYYPFNGACANILLNILIDGGLKARFQDISVLTIKQRPDDIDIEIIDSIKIFRIFLWSSISKQELKKLLSKGCFFKFLYAFFCKILFFFTKKISDNFIDFIASFHFYRALKKYHAEKYDAIVSISGKYEVSIAVDKFSKKKDIPFIFYQLDPASTNQTCKPKTKKLRKKVELSIYSHAKKIVTTPIIYGEHQTDHFSRFLDKTTFLEFPLVKPTVHLQKANSPIRCMFLGSFYGNIRNPDYTIALFESLMKKKLVSLEFVGNVDEKLKQYEKKFPIKCWGVKTLDVCKKMILQADVLINIGNSINNQIPSKIFDYISTGMPIVNICKIKSCPTLSYFKRYRPVVNLFEDDTLFEEQKIRLERFLYHLPQTMNVDEINESFYDCTPQYVADKFYKILKDF